MTKIDKLAKLAEKLPESNVEKLPESNVEKLTLVAQGMAMAQGSGKEESA